MQLLLLVLTVSSQLIYSVSSNSDLVASSIPATRDVFNFDFTWSPLRPLTNDTVHFKAVGLGQAEVQRWGLTNASFRWYRQLPSADFRLVHVGRRFSRSVSEYFEGRYRLSVKMTIQPEPPQQPDSAPPPSWSRVDIVKYIGLQRRIHSALIVKNHTDNRPGRRVVCRFWGYPLVETLKLAAPTPACLASSHFETVESEPYIDLVSDCSGERLPPGEYSCYGRNSVGASRLKCRLAEDQGGMLGKMKDCPDFAAEEYAAVSLPGSRHIAGSQLDAAAGPRLASGGMATVFGCLATVILSLVG